MTCRRSSVVSSAGLAVCVSLLTGAAAPVSAWSVRRSMAAVKAATPQLPSPALSPPLPPLVAFSEPLPPASGLSAPRRCSRGPGSRRRASRPQARSPPRAERFTGRSPARGRTGRARSWCSRRTIPRAATPFTPLLGRGEVGRRLGGALRGREGVRPRRGRRALGLPGLRRRVRAEERRAAGRGGREHGRDGEVLGPRGERLEHEHAPAGRGQQHPGPLQHLRLGPPRARCPARTGSASSASRTTPPGRTRRRSRPWSGTATPTRGARSTC